MVGSADIVVASYSSSTGTHVRSQRFGGTSGDYARGITSPAGTSDVCIIGDFSDTVMVGATRLTSRGGSDVLVACFSSLLSPRWARGYGSTSYDRGYNVRYLEKKFRAERNVWITSFTLTLWILLSRITSQMKDLGKERERVHNLLDAAKKIS